MNVAQPSPYRPGSEVSTRTTTSGMPSGAVTIARTAVIVSPSRAGHGAWVSSITRPSLVARGQPWYPAKIRVNSQFDWLIPLHESAGPPVHGRSRLTDQNVSRARWWVCA